MGLAVAVWSWPAQVAVAADSGAITVAPVFQNVEIGRDQANSKYFITVTNHSNVDQDFRFSALDFGSLNETGGVAFVGDTATDFTSKHGLAKWMSLDKDTATIPAGGEMQLGVTLRNDSSLSVGGHYGAVIAEALTAPGGSSSKVQVGVKQAVSSLFLLVKDGAAPPNLQLVSQVPGASSWFKLPQDVVMRFSNDGDVHVVPRGVTQVRDPAGKVVERGALNEDSGIILPGAFRKYDTPLMGMTPAWMPGRYVLSTTYRYDGSDATKVLVTTFWYVGPVAVVGMLALVLVVAGGGIWWLWVRRRRKPAASGWFRWPARVLRRGR